MNKIKPLLFLSLSLLLLAGCASAPSTSTNFESADMSGMLYDYRNTPCTGAVITLDGKSDTSLDSSSSVTSDVNGRFMLPNVTKGEHTIVITSKGFETFETSFTFYSTLQVFYTKLISYEELLEKAEEAIDEKEYQRSMNFIDRAEIIYPNKMKPGFLRAIIAYRQNNTEEAASILQSLLEIGHEDISIQQFLEKLEN